MITIEGAPHRLCSGVTRRDALRIGAFGIAGLTLADLLALKAEAAPAPGKAKAIVMIHLSGGPSHVDTYDPKPDAPMEIRGEFKAIPTKLDGCQIGELFPLQAGIMDRLALIRSVSRVTPEEHASSLMVTGYSNTERRASGDKPSIGAVMAKLKANPDALMPSYISLRDVNSETGLGAAHLGPTCEPLWVNGPGREDLHLRISAARLTNRRRMLDQFDSCRQIMETAKVGAQNTFARRALELVSSSTVYDALKVEKETKETRERYGNDQFLLARRLIEAGVQCVALEHGGWDTHGDNFNSLKRLMPSIDKPFVALMNDLKDRGLERDVVVVMWGEFGRTPKVNGQAGRDHWPPVMSAILAGGGLKVGQVIGSTDSTAYEAKDDPIRVREVVATLYHALGIDPATTFVDQQQRPVPLIHDAEPIAKLVG